MTNRLPETYLKDSIYGVGSQVPLLDLSKVGQHGHMVNFPAYNSSMPFVRRQMQVRMLRLPGFISQFRGQGVQDKLAATLKHIVEIAPLEITGYTATLNVETVDTPVGGAGEIMQAPSNVTRARSEPQLQYNEKDNRSIGKFWNWYIEMALGSPETKFGLINTLEGTTHTDMLSDFIGWAMIAWEPDSRGKGVVQAYLSTNCWPTTAAPIESARSINNGGEKLDFGITLAALTQVGAGVDLVAQFFQNQTSFTGGNPNLRPAMQDQISADLLKAATGQFDQLSDATKRMLKL